MKKVPLIDLKPEYNFLKNEINLKIKECLNNQQWILGPQVIELEKRIAAYLGAKYSAGVASGTDALLIALRALSLSLKKKEFFSSKDEIITTPFTFVATAEAIVKSGAKPVFVDIEPDSFNISPEAVEKALNKNTIGILPVHIYGRACDMGKIKKIAKKNNLFILEDCAQSFGAAYKKKKLGTWGDVAAFSFFPTKNLGGFGDGGMVTAKNKKVADFIKILRGHGQTSQYKADYCGYNSRLDSLQAAILLVKLKYIDKFNQKRIQIAKIYNQAFKDIPQLQILNSKSKAPGSEPSHIYHLYTLKVCRQKRDKLIKYLGSKGISARAYYPLGLDKMKAFRLAKIPFQLRNSRQAAKEVLSLPIYPFMEKDKVDYVIENLIKGLKS